MIASVDFNANQTPETPTPSALGGFDLTLKQPLNPQPTREETKTWLLALGLPPLPVAPAFDAYEYPKTEKANAETGVWEHCPLTPDFKPIPEFTGKNPSYLDAEGIPHSVTHGKYQDRMPSERELKEWFVNPKTGIGTLGRQTLRWLDFDVKHFTDTEECKAEALARAAKIHELSGYEPTVEETHSGGWRVQVYTEEKPTFTNFALTPGGNHVGEALGAGRFTVLAPTVGPSGNRYVAYHRHSPETNPLIPHLENIDVYSSGKTKGKREPLTSTNPASTPKPKPTSVVVSGRVPLSQLVSKKAQEILRGVNDKGDRSDALATALNDLYGWVNKCNENALPFSEDVETLAYEAGQALGLDADKIGRILKTIDVAACTPALEYRGKDCLKHYKKVAKANGVKVSANASESNASSNANAKVIPLPTATPFPKAVGDSGGVPPVPPNYGGGRGGSSPNDGSLDWNPPIPLNGQLVYPRKGSDRPYEVMCNFDFIVTKEFVRHVPENESPSDPDGGGVQIKITRALDGKSKTINLSSQEYKTTDKFTEALKAKMGMSVICRLRNFDLHALMEVKLEEYHASGGKVYTLASMIGQQPDGTWVFPKVKFTPSGQPITADDNLWIFNANVSSTDKLPYPNIPVEQDVNVLTELIHAIQDVAGTNKNRWLLALGWVVMWLNKWHIPHNNLPLLASYGNPGTLKTRKMLAALSVIWGDEEEKNTLRKTSESYLYEILSRLTVPFLWDDAKATTKDERKVIDNVIIDVYGRLPRRVRGQDQTPQTSMLITSNPQLGDALDAAQSRLVHIFLPQSGVKPTSQALRRLKNAKKEAPKAFSGLIRIGYDQDNVDKLTDTLRERLSTAHDRAPHHLALVVYYTQKVLELAGVSEDILTWVLDEFCPDVNADQSSIDALSDFFERLDTAKSIGLVGDWNLRVTSGSGGGQHLALYMPSIWQAIKRVGEEPSSYNKAMIERLLKEKGAKGGTVRLAQNKLQVDTHEVGYVRGDDLAEMRNPSEEPRYCLKLPYAVFEAYQKPDDPVMSPPPNHITNHITNNNDGVVSVPAPTSTSCNVCNVVMCSGEGQEEKIIAELDASEKTLTPHDAKNESQDKNASPVSVPHITDITTFQTPSPPPETSAPHSVDVVMGSVMNSPCNEPYGYYTSEMTPDDWAEIHQFTKTDEYQQWLTETDDEEEWLKLREDLEVAFALDTDDFTDATENETNAQAPKLPLDDNLIKLGVIATEMIHCAHSADVEALRASFSGEAIEAAKDLLGDEERELFEAIANGCANLSPAVAELAQEQTPNLVGRRIRGKNSRYTSFGKLFTISRQEGDSLTYLDGNEEKYLDLSEIGSTWELLE